MSHDLTAELAGYRNALASELRRGRDDRAEAIAGEIDRVTGNIGTAIEGHLAQAEAHESNDQHMLGAQARERAGRLRRALEADPPPAAETTQQKAPRERAVTKKAGA
jgi:hypothetical protein